MDDDAAGPRGRLGTLLRGHRAAAGLTQRQLAGLAGVSLGALEDLEQGRTRRPRREALPRLAAALRLGQAELEELARAADGRPPPATGARRGMRVEVLGPLAVWRDGQALPAGPVRLRAVLGLLAVHAGTGLPRAVLVDALWGQAPPRSAAAMIQAQASQVRRLLGNGQAPGAGPRLSWDGASYRLCLAGISLDLAEFGELAGRARQAAAGGDAAGACELYERALGLWRGQPLEDVDMLYGHPAITELARRRVAVVIDYADAAAEARQQDRVASHLAALAAREPLDERLHASLMRNLAATGRQAAALRAYTEIAGRLDAELGVRPGPELAAAHLEVLRQQVPPAVTRPAVAGGRAEAGPVVPRQLPADVLGFAGRATELDTLTRLLDQATVLAGTVVISAIGGTAGVGKTALAVHWAHQVASRFPDGQLHVNLRGFGPAGAAMRPEAAVRLFLDGLGVAAQRIPAGLEAQAALYRSLLAGRRMLIVADNARDAEQVRPLIPGAPGCLMLVTSRNQLTGLAASHGARLLGLEVLTQAEAGELLERRLGRDRAAAEPAAVAELSGLCARLPLALSVVAARAAARPDLPLAMLAGELRDARARLDGLGTGDAVTDVRTVLSWSYRQLSQPAARLFRLLGVHPGADITIPAAASLAALPPAQAEQALSELTQAHLLTEHEAGRYAFHDLLRAYAAEQARAHEDNGSRRAAIQRVLDYYLHTACAAARPLNPYRDQITLSPALPQVCSEAITTFERALEWFSAEWRVLLGALSRAAGDGFPEHAWKLFWAAATFLYRNGYLREEVAAGEAALSAVRRLGDQAGQAVVHRHLGQVQLTLRAYDEAAQHLNAALSLFHRLGDRAEARTQIDLLELYNAQGRHHEALPHGEQALRLYRVFGYGPGEALALNAVGWTLAQAGRYQEALVHCADAHAMSGVLRGDPVAQANVLDSLGYIHSRMEHHAEAISCYQQAIGLLAGTQAVTLRARMLAHLGDAQRAAGDTGAARRAWQQSLRILDDVQHPEADRVRARLG